MATLRSKKSGVFRREREESLSKKIRYYRLYRASLIPFT